MRTIEQNFKKNPHTARFLMAFHTAGGTNLGGGAVADDTQALAAEAAQDDLLDLVRDEPADLRSPRQAELMESLVKQIGELNLDLGCQAASYTMRMTEHGRWTAGREGNASAWISKMIAKVTELKAAAPKPVSTGTATTIPAGRYAVETDEIRCYTVEYGKEGTRWAGFTFLNRISSDDRFPIRNADEKARILDAIRADVDASALLAALTLRICRGTMKNGQPCARTLSDTKNPFFNQGYGPECGKNL